ncbi:MAG: N-acetylglucosamine-6-phosphate deacetylase [Erysipelotrichia bacterium]|nr:N-acetylglucosamine-6-phosphate deacetylase [Erysipelotrichia bacterium]
MKTLIENGHLIIDGSKEIKNGAILINGTSIERLFLEPYPKNVSADSVVDAHHQLVQPGFIDTHMHGAAGKDFIEGETAVPLVSENIICDGTTAFLASLTVMSQQETISALSSLKNAVSEGAEFLGVHLEGPYLSKEYKALMDERYLRDPNITELDEMLKANPNIRTMTIAPEKKGMNNFIPYLKSRGIVPMIGHTNCTCEEALNAHLLGAEGYTHLYNAMSQHTHRNPGCVTSAFLSKDMYKELMMDGFHVDSNVVKMTYEAMGPERILMITDSMLGKGAADGDYTFSGLKCHKEGIHVRVIETGRIAGSAFGMNDAARFIQQLCNASFNDVVQMACVNPAKLLHAEDRMGTLNPGSRANITICSEQYEPSAVYVDGRIRFSR